MEFETIKKDNRKKWVVGVIAILAITSVVFFVSTRANYKTTERLNLINTKVNWNPTDLEIVSIKLKDGDNYTDTNTVPTSGYTLSNESYCTVNGSRDTNIPIEYKDGKVSVGISKKGTKCYLFFDKSNLKDIILASNGGETIIKAKGNPDFSKTSCTSGVYNGISRTCGEDTTGMWAMEDDYGTSYYFRGSPTNNYVKFAGYYWRIIRINGDGSIRLIYDGTEYHANGISTSNRIAVVSQTFNSSANDNAYVGYTYATGSKRGTGTSSNAKTQLDAWYTSSGLTNYASYLSDSGFCGDRTSTTTYGGKPNNTGGTGTTTTYYGAYYRLYTKKDPTLKCSTISYESGYESGNKDDVYTVNATKGNGQLTYPVGLISADEASVAGGIAGTINYAYYLYNGNSYWTMSPIKLVSQKLLIGTDDDPNGEVTSYYADVWKEPEFICAGCLEPYNVSNKLGLRPVINIEPTKINNVTIDSQGVYVVS